MQLNNMLQSFYEFKCGDSQTTTRHFPFEIKIKLPPPRLARQIIERDKWGRIVHAIPPQLST